MNVRMEPELPDDMRLDIREAAELIVGSLRAAGWYVSAIRWDSQTVRTVSLSAKSPTGRCSYMVCGESELPGQLSALLNLLAFCRR